MSLPQLIASANVDFTGGSASVNHNVTSSSLTQIEDVVLVAIYLGAPQPTIATPAEWTLVNSVTNLIGGRLSVYYKIATANGSETVDFVSSTPTFGTCIVSTMRGLDLINPIQQFSHQEQSSAITYTTPSVSVSGNTGILIFGLADDTTLRTWSTSPSLTQQAISFAAEVSQMACFFDIQVSTGASAAYAVSKTGSNTAGMAEAVFFRTASLTILNPPSTAGIVGAAYDSFPVVTGGNGNYTFSISTGALPPGLSIVAGTGEILGTPTTAGLYQFRLHVIDSIGNSADLDTSILVSSLAYTQNTPHVIEATVGDVALVNTNLDGGVIQYIPINGSLYALAANFRISTGTTSPRMFKSTDGGNTWTALDTAHEVTSTSQSTAHLRGTEAWLLFENIGGGDVSFRVVSFDFSAELWGTPSTQATGYFIFTDHVNIGVLSDGSLVIAYNKTNGPTWLGEVIRYNGATWSSPVTLFSHTHTSYPASMSVDASDNAWILCAESISNVFPDTANVYKYASGTLTGPTAAYSTTFSIGNIWGPGIYLAIYDEIRFPAGALHFSDGNIHIAYIKGTPSSGPTWSVVDVAIDNGRGPTGSPISFAYESDTAIYMVWETQFDSNTGWTQIVFTGQTNNGPWGDPISASSLALGISMSGYAVNDTGTIDGGATKATYVIDAVSGGQVTAYHLTASGTGYSSGHSVTTTNLTGLGSGFAVDIFNKKIWDSLADPLQPPSPQPSDVRFLGAQLVRTSPPKLGAVIGLFQNLPVNGGFCGLLYYVAAPVSSSSASEEITVTAGAGATFTFSGAAVVFPGAHTVCIQTVGGGGGVLTDTPYIVRSYQFNNEKMPPDTVFFTPWSDLGYQFQKVARNILLDIDTGGFPCQIDLQVDGTTRQTFTVTSTSNDRDRVLSVQSDVEGKLCRLALTPSASLGAKSQLFTAGLDFALDTNILTHADTLEQNFGFTGWKALKQCWVQYKGGPLTLTFLTDGGSVFYTITLPAQSVRDMARFYFPAVNAGVLNKSKKYRVKMDGTSGFRLYADSLIEFIPFGSDQRGSFSLAGINPELPLPVAQPTVGMWSL